MQTNLSANDTKDDLLLKRTMLAIVYCSWALYCWFRGRPAAEWKWQYIGIPITDLIANIFALVFCDLGKCPAFLSVYLQAAFTLGISKLVQTFEPGTEFAKLCELWGERNFYIAKTNMKGNAKIAEYLHFGQ